MRTFALICARFEESGSIRKQLEITQTTSCITKTHFLPYSPLSYAFRCCHCTTPLCQHILKHLLPSLQFVFSEHFKFDPQSGSYSHYTEAAHSNWLSQANLTRFMNKCCLLPAELLTLPTGFLSVLSVTVSHCSFLLSSHSSFTHILITLHKSKTSINYSQILKRSCSHALRCHEWKRTLTFASLPHT